MKTCTENMEETEDIEEDANFHANLDANLTLINLINLM
jgi:hypothetical protein